MGSVNLMVGFDRRMPDAYMVAVKSARLYNRKIRIEPILLAHVRALGLYKRPYIGQSGSLYDVISEAPMATEFALSRFLIPYLNGYKGWTIFCDSDFLFRCDPEEVLSYCLPHHAVTVVQHKHEPSNNVKMDGQKQTHYYRKNWSSFIVFNNEHPAHKRLTLDSFNYQKGLYFHQFGWLMDEEIGALPAQYNYLVGITKDVLNPKIVHFTDGTPDMKGFEDVEYAQEWRGVLGMI